MDCVSYAAVQCALSYYSENSCSFYKMCIRVRRNNCISDFWKKADFNPFENGGGEMPTCREMMSPAVWAVR